MKRADYKVVYDKTIEVFGKGLASNITKQRWAGRWRYRVGGGANYHFETASQAREWLTSYGESVTYTANDLLELTAEAVTMWINIAPYTNMKWTSTDMNSVYKCLNLVNYLGDRYADTAKNSVIGNYMSEVERDRVQLKNWFEHLKELSLKLKTVSIQKKEYILSKKADRLNKRISILERDFTRWRVEGWQPIKKQNLTVVYRTQKLAI